MAELSVISNPLEVGTRIHWDKDTNALYFVDVPLSEFYKYDVETGKLTKTTVGSEPLGFAFPVAGSNEEFIAALGKKIVLFRWDGFDPSVTLTEDLGEVDTEPELKGNRLNGGKVDPYGRLWAGTMGPTDSEGNTEPGKGSLYSVSKGVIKKHLSGIGISNGLAWNVDLKKMYYIDTTFLGVYEFDYDSATGEISNQKVVFKFSDYNINGSPDGLTIDTEGNLWVAVIYGEKIIRFDPRNEKLLEIVKMPTPQITALSFGSPSLDVLYVNSAKMAVNGEIPEYPAGCTFKIANLGFKGLPGDRYLK